MKYNGVYLDFRRSKFYDVKTQDNPSGMIDEWNEEEAEVIFDLLWAEFIDMYENAIKYNGTLVEKCNTTYKPGNTTMQNHNLEFKQF